jgi:ATP/maltotriose-dependent transcriptional regulator MalT
MSYAEPRWSRTQVELLMDISATFADLTGALGTCEQIPAYLSRILDLDCLSLVLVQDAGEPTITLQVSSGPVAADEGTRQYLLALYQQTRPLTTSDGPTLRTGVEEGISEAQLPAMDGQRLAAFPRATVVARTLDGQYRMLLVVHQGAQEPSLAASKSDLLQLAADALAKQLGALVSWKDRLEQIGDPFDRLTEREWVVLQGLLTEAGEKQLADQLGLSPHTLHSHIKSIYRKAEVQGRLPLLTRVQAVMRERRLARVNCPKEPLGRTLAAAAVAAG